MRKSHRLTSNADFRYRPDSEEKKTLLPKEKKASNANLINLVGDDEGEGEGDLDTGDDADSSGEDKSIREYKGGVAPHGTNRKGLDWKGSIVSTRVNPPPVSRIQPLRSVTAGNTDRGTIIRRLETFKTEVLMALSSLDLCVSNEETKRSSELAQTVADLLSNNVEARSQSVQQVRTAEAKVVELTEVIAGLRAELTVLTQELAQQHGHMLWLGRFVVLPTLPPVPTEEKSVVELPLPLPGPSQESVAGGAVVQETIEATSTSSSVTPGTGDVEEGAEEKEQIRHS